jgi:hypothetical protein
LKKEKTDERNNRKNVGIKFWGEIVGEKKTWKENLEK